MNPVSYALGAQNPIPTLAGGFDRERGMAPCRWRIPNCAVNPERTGVDLTRPEPVRRVIQPPGTRWHSIGRHVTRFRTCPGASIARTSGRYRRLIQPATVRLPSIGTDTRAGADRLRARFRRAAIQPRMRAMTVKV